MNRTTRPFAAAIVDSDDTASRGEGPTPSGFDTLTDRGTRLGGGAVGDGVVGDGAVGDRVVGDGVVGDGAVGGGEVTG